AYDGLNAYAPDFLESLSTSAHFALTPHSDARAGLKRIYQQIESRNPATTFEAFLKDTEAAYKIREEADREHIRQKLLSNRINEKAADFRLQTLDGESYTLSDMPGKVVMLDVGASWCGPCNMAIPHVKTVYKHFSKSDDVVILGINDGETPQKVRKSLDEHQPPWPVLLDPTREVAKAYKVRAIPKFIFIDKNGYWQYNFGSSNIIDGQPLIWMIEALLSDA
ncbi:MAG: TlpA family protein disulfide reductase, partial [Proteobacteria bacterium]|nr:TlpA family protein disulfide reductase [Pseudomonadota bacterium]